MAKIPVKQLDANLIFGRMGGTDRQVAANFLPTLMYPSRKPKRGRQT